MAEATIGNTDTVKVGSTGTIGSLITRELQSLKEEHQVSSTRKKLQSAPVSVPCGSTPVRSQAKKNQTNGSCSGSSSNHNNDNTDPVGVHKTKPRKSGYRVPMLGAEDVNSDRNLVRDEKKPSSFFVEVVDLKCNSPMGNRLKKLGFSKLSES